MADFNTEDASYVAQIAYYGGVTEPALRLVLSLLAPYPIALVHRYTMYGKNITVQHIFFIISGLGIGYFNYGTDALHSAVSVLVVYAILAVIGGTAISVFLVFVLSMGYLLVGYYLTGTETYDIKWTLPQCILTLRLIGLAFSVYDGKKPIEELSAEQTMTALVRKPTFLEVAGHTYFPASFLIGPQYSMKRYLNFVSGLYRGSPNTQQLPKCFYTGIKRGALGLVYLGIHKLGISYLPDSIISPGIFEILPFWKKCTLLVLWGKITLYKYISCWLITEGACISIGLTYNGISEDGEMLWNGCANVNLWVFEGASKLSHYIDSFNISTNQWIAQYIYKRLKFLGNRYVSQVLTLVFIAVWHGLHSGYYMCFFMEFVVINFEKDLESLIMKNEKVTSFIEQPWVKPIIWILLKLYALLFMSYCLLSFVLLSFPRWWQVYKSIYFFGHIIFVPWPCYYPLVKFLLSTSRQQHTE